MMMILIGLTWWLPRNCYGLHPPAGDYHEFWSETLPRNCHHCRAEHYCSQWRADAETLEAAAAFDLPGGQLVVALGS